MRSIAAATAAAACLTLFPHPPAAAGVIQGTLASLSRPSRAPAPIEAYPGRASALADRPAVVRGQLGDAVVYVDRIPAHAESALAARPAERPRMAQKDQTFVPRVIAVATGTRVEFPNLDAIYHNVFSLSPAQRFDLGKYPRGGSREVAFRKPGLVNVFCDIHSDMEGFILILPHHAFTRPKDNGEFALGDLPRGRYTLKAWHPDLGEASAEVDVPAQGTVASRLEFPR
jgi:plastocyanin